MDRNAGILCNCKVVWSCWISVDFTCCFFLIELGIETNHSQSCDRTYILKNCMSLSNTFLYNLAFSWLIRLTFLCNSMLSCWTRLPYKWASTEWACWSPLKDIIFHRNSGMFQNLSIQFVNFINQELILKVITMILSFIFGWGNLVKDKKMVSMFTFFVRMQRMLISSWFSRFWSSLTPNPERSCPINCLQSVRSFYLLFMFRVWLYFNVVGSCCLI